MTIWDRMPSKETLLKELPGNNTGIPKVNAHMHTPYSFSAFNNIPQALNMAVEEGVSVVGINDFYSTDGYEEWANECLKRNLFPLFNIEFISLNKEDQANSIRVNDPKNPGRTYLSGKGLAFPQNLREPYLSQLLDVKRESNLYVAKMCGKINEILQSIGAGFELSYQEIELTLTRGNVRERHLARALREKVSREFPGADEQKAFYGKLFGEGKEFKSPLNDCAAVENEIRGSLLKAGGAAFVPENPKAFLEMEAVRQVILKAGGIPTYPFLADDATGNFTNFEEDLGKATEILKARGIYSAEFIPSRNSPEVLEKYAGYLYNAGFIVTFGSEHNTPAMEPITLYARNKTQLSERLMEINYKGASVIAAHQYLYATEGEGYVDEDGKPCMETRGQYEKLGDALIRQVIKKAPSNPARGKN